MTRHTFLADLASWVTDTGTSTTSTSGLPAVASLAIPGHEVTFWDSPSGGTRHTDLLDATGSPVTSATSASDGSLPQISGPDGVRTMWADAAGGAGPRRICLASDLGESANTVDTTLAGLSRAQTAWVNAKQAGAAGDGVTDDTAAVQAALDSVPATGGVVYLPAGDYLVSAQLNVTHDNTTVIGDGCGQQTGATQNGRATRILAAPGFTGGAVFLAQASPDTAGIPLYGVTFRDFTIDGQNNGTAVDGIHQRSNRSLIDHVHVHRMTGNGFRLHGYSSPATFNTYDSVISHSQAGNCAAAGVLFDANSADCHLLACVIYSNGINVLILASSQQITSCHFYNATTDNIQFGGGGSRTKIVGCKIEGAGQHGVNIDSTSGGYSDIQIIGNGLSTNGDSANNAYDHIIIQGPSGNGVTRTLITGNSIGHKSGGSANLNRYGVNLASSAAQGTVITGNSFGDASQFGTAQINYGGSTSSPAVIKANANAADSPAAPHISVTDAPYFARGNGSADDTAALQAALDAVPSTGGTVVIPAGEYKITAPLWVRTDNTLIMGSGQGNRIGATQVGRGTRIKVDPAFAGGSYAVMVQRTADDRTVYGVKIADLAVDGQSVAGPVGGILWKAVRGQLLNVAVHNCTGYGVTVTGYTTWAATDSQFTGCDFSWNATGALFGANGPDNKVTGCVFSNNTSDGAEVAVAGTQFGNCDFWANTRYGAWLNNAGSRTRFTGCKFRLSGQHGLILDSTTTGFSDVGVTGCGFHTNGTSAASTYDGLILTGGTANAISRCAITGCNFSYESGSSPNKARYGANFSNSATQHAVLVGNSFGTSSAWGTAGVNDNSNTSSPAKIRGNSGWVTSACGTATIPSGLTSVAVTHGLSATPSVKHISVTPANSLGLAAKFWVSAVTSTTFTISTDTDPGATTAVFAWQAEIIQ